MEFLRAVEDDLRALSVEARKKHPVVKEAAERGIVRLRALREQYAAAVRESGESPPPRAAVPGAAPPVLAGVQPRGRGKAMTLHALGAIAHLMNRDAISPADAPNILRVLAIQAVPARRGRAGRAGQGAADAAPDGDVAVLRAARGGAGLGADRVPPADGAPARHGAERGAGDVAANGQPHARPRGGGGGRQRRRRGGGGRGRVQWPRGLAAVARPTPRRRAAWRTRTGRR